MATTIERFKTITNEKGVRIMTCSILNHVFITNLIFKLEVAIYRNESFVMKCVCANLFAEQTSPQGSAVQIKANVAAHLNAKDLRYYLARWSKRCGD